MFLPSTASSRSLGFYFILVYPSILDSHASMPHHLKQKDFFQLKELEKLGPKMKGIGENASASTLLFSGVKLRLNDLDNSNLHVLFTSLSVRERGLARSSGRWTGAV